MQTTQKSCSDSTRDASKHESNVRQADFGFTTVLEHEKEAEVKAVFSSVAANYDLMNDLMSLGSHRIWKRVLLDWMQPRAGHRILDIAGGTGDISRAALERSGGEAELTLCDINIDMINAGRDKTLADFGAGCATGIRRVCGNAEALPFADGSFDIAVNSFGLRNVTHIDAALAEAQRVLRPMGRCFILEFSAVQTPVLESFYETYSFSVLPKLGEIIAKDRDAYQYLAESIRMFPAQQEVCARLKSVGFKTIKMREMFCGIATLYCGWA